MANIFLAWQNRTDDGTLSGGSWLSSLPLVNLQNRQVQKVARSTNATTASTQFQIDLSTARNIGVVALVGHNISVTGQVRISCSDTATFTTTQYTSGWVDVWPAGVVPMASLNWEDTNFWLGTLSDEQRKGFQSPYILRLASAQIARYWKVEISDVNNTDGYLQVGRLFMAAGWTPSINYTYGAALGYQDPTPVDTSLSGAEYFDVRPKYRVMDLGFDYLGQTDAYGYVLEMQRVAGVSGELLVMPDGGADASQRPIISFVGRLRQMGATSQTKPNAYSVKFEIKELL